MALFHAMGDEFHALLHLADFLQDAGLAEFHAGASFVDEVEALSEESDRECSGSKGNRIF